MTDNRFFAAYNGGGGFCSAFGGVFDPGKFDAVYIIKGGPGTGKSTFMKKLGEEAERRGYDPRYYFCSSDVSSLDGVVIDELGVCVLDGTAPHVTEAKYPGACENILNFGEAFDAAALRAKRSDVERLSAKSGEMYSRAYACLRAARESAVEERRVLGAAYLRSKAAAYIRRTFGEMSRGAVCETCLTTVCAEGTFRLPTYFSRARRVSVIDEYYGAGYLFITDIAAYARAAGLCAAVVPDPVCPGFYEGVYFIKDGVYVTVDRGDAPKDAKKINASRFVGAAAVRSDRKYLRAARKLSLSALSAATDAMAGAHEAHAELEKIYVAHTDFSVVDEIFARVKESIFEK